MKIIHHPWLLIVALTTAATFLFGQSDNSVQTSSQPVISVMGENEQLLTVMAESHSATFLAVCGNDMEFAYEKWMEMLGAMEDLSEDLNFDIRGVKTYLQVFWDADGSIAHLAFYPKTNSRNVPHTELKAFFAEFARNYKLPLTYEKGFSHYGSAAFPTFSRPEYNVKRNQD